MTLLEQQLDKMSEVELQEYISELQRLRIPNAMRASIARSTAPKSTPTRRSEQFELELDKLL